MSGPSRLLLLALLLVTVAHAAPAAAQFIQQGNKFTNGSLAAPQYFGNSIAISADGNTAVVGAPYYGNFGFAFVYARTGGTWVAQNTGLQTSAIGYSLAGYAVAISADGNTIAVGGYGDISNAGGVWMFVRSGTSWVAQGSKLVGAGEVGAGDFGFSLALSADGNTLVAGAQLDNGGAGAVWVYTRANGVWTAQGGKLTGPGAVGGAEFGYSVALSADGNTLLAGGPVDNAGAGATWTFKRAAGSWSPSGTKLVGTGGTGATQQGIAVAITPDGSTAAVGGNSDNGGAGATWVFTRSGSSWLQQGPRLVGSNGIGISWQGISVALSSDGNTLVVGGATDNGSAGAVWHFTRANGAWTQVGDKLTGALHSGSAQFGSATALSADGHTLLVGGPADATYLGAFW